MARLSRFPVMNVTPYLVALEGSTERRQTQPIKLPAPPAALPEPISDERQEIADMLVPNVPTWRNEVTALGHRTEELAKRHPGAALLACLGLGMAMGATSLLLMHRRDTPRQRAKRGLRDFSAALHDLVAPAANHAVQRGVDATTHGLHAAGKKLEAAADSSFLGRLRRVFA
jgi:hypothetical protein